MIVINVSLFLSAIFVGNSTYSLLGITTLECRYCGARRAVAFIVLVQLTGVFETFDLSREEIEGFA